METVKTLVIDMTAEDKAVQAELEAFMLKSEDVETAEALGLQLLQELEEAKAVKETALNKATDLVNAKTLLKEVKELQEDIELQKAINLGTAEGNKQDLIAVAGDFFKAYESAKAVWNELHKETCRNVSLNTAEEQFNTIDTFGHSLNRAFSRVKGEMIDTNIVTQADKFFTGNLGYKVHLGQMSLISKGNNIKIAFKQLSRELSL